MRKPFVTRVISFGAAVAAVAMLAGCGSAASSQAGTSIISNDQTTSAAAGSQTSSTASQQTVTKAVDTSAAQSSPAVEDGNFNQNPSTKLPDSISSSVPDNATVVSRDYAQKKDGTVVSLKDGSKVTDPKLVGTQDTPPDPLAISGGKRFIPVSVADTKKQMVQAQNAQTGDSQADSSANSDAHKTQGSATRSGRAGSGAVQAAVAKSDNASQTTSGSVTAVPALRRDASLKRDSASVFASDGSRTQAIEYPSNRYGTHWGTSGGQQAIFSRTNRRVLTNVLHGVDVSQFQQDIDWSAAKNAGVQAAVVRLGYGVDNTDPKAARNTSDVRNAGLKYGFYWYSYAYDNDFARQEAQSLISVLRQYGVRPGSTALPIYYDLEAYAWSAHPHPTSPSVYRGIVQTWVNTMRAAGYTNVAVYSYTSYLGSELNDSYIHSMTSWAAQYAGDLQYSFTTSQRSWQYDDSGHINGIPGNVDLDAFDTTGSVDITKAQQITVSDGIYYIIPASNATASVDVPGGSTANSTKLATYSANGTVAQQFRFSRNADGTYTITNVHSGKVLDVPGAVATEGVQVQQYEPNGTNAQKWYIRQRSTGAYYLQSALGNWVLGTTATAGNSTPLELEMPGDVTTQRFLLSSQTSVPTGKTVRITSALAADRVVDVAGASTANNAKIDAYAWNATKAQQFVLDKRGNSVYSIRNVNSGKVLDVAAGLTSNGAVIDQYAWNGTQAQLWVVRDAGSGYVNLYNPASGRVMEIPGASTQNGAQIKLYTANGSAAQKWKIETYTEQKDPGTDTKPTTQILPDGVYRFESVTDRSYVMEVAGANRASGANVSLYRWNGTNAQKWRVKNLGGDMVTLTNVASGKLLDLVGAAARNGQNVDQYTSNGTKAQQWHVERSGTAVILRSAVDRQFVLDLVGNSARDSSNIDVYSLNGTTAQKWYAMKVPTQNTSGSTILPDGIYRFESSTDRSSVIETAAASRANGANVRLWRWNGTAAQQWRVKNFGSNVVTLENISSGKMLDLVGAAARNGQNVDQYVANNTNAQKWEVEQSGGAVILRSAVNQRFVLDLVGNNTRDGANIDVYSANGTLAQKWYATRL